MKADQRLWRTADGGLVEDGHEDAAFLAYAPGDVISDADAKRLPGRKEQARPEDKMAGKPEDKAAAKPAARPAKKVASAKPKSDD